MMYPYVVASLTLLALSSFTVACEPCKEEGCLVGSLYYQKGEQWQPEGECAQATCRKDGSYTKLACPKIFVSKGWSLSSEDPSRPYPDCCPKAIPPSDSQ